MIVKRTAPKDDFDILTQKGILGFYESCEITQLFIYDKKTETVTNLYILVSFEEKPFEKINSNYLTSPSEIQINKNISIGIRRYWQTIQEVRNTYDNLSLNKRWDEKLILGNMRKLPKQFISVNDGSPVNRVLKNNFHGGSHTIEFFDESKSLYDSLLDIDKIEKFNSLIEKVKKYVPIDLSVVRDRVGNIIFQFPITTVRVSSRALEEWNGSRIEFKWHREIKTPYDCYILLESNLDKITTGSALVEYNKQVSQDIISGCVNNMHKLIVYQKENNLILHWMNAAYLKHFSTGIGIVNPEPRIFYIDGKRQRVDVASQTSMQSGVKREYSTFIRNRLYDEEKLQLEKQLSFKQYFSNQRIEALNDVRLLISKNDENGVFLWDPYLSAQDIINTLFFSTKSSVPLKAICSINTIKKKANRDEGIKESIETIFETYKSILSNPNHNNLGLNLEYRTKLEMFGWEFHDRFLIFPGSMDKKSKVYSLGTSVNSLGKSHHILQEVNHPQRIVDAFLELWDKLNNNKCLIWQSPNSK